MCRPPFRAPPQGMKMLHLRSLVVALAAAAVLTTDRADAQSCDACATAGYRHGQSSYSSGGSSSSKASITSLRFRYTGSVAAGNTNSQGDKTFFRASGTLPAVGTFSFNGQTSAGVAVGEVFTITAFSGANSMIYLGSSYVNIHTSCSRALQVGDHFGFLELVGFTQSSGATELSNGCAPAAPACYETGVPCPVAPAPSPAPPCDVCEVGGGKGNFRLVLTVVGGPTWRITNNQAGKGYATGDTLPASGSFNILCYNRKYSQATFFSGLVAHAGTFTTQSGMGAETECTVSQGGLTQVVGIHTSCSKYLKTGMQIGALVVTGFVDGQGRSSVDLDELARAYGASEASSYVTSTETAYGASNPEVPYNAEATYGASNPEVPYNAEATYGASNPEVPATYGSSNPQTTYNAQTTYGSNPQVTYNAQICPGPVHHPTPACDRCCITPPVLTGNATSLITPKTAFCSGNDLPVPELSALTKWVNNLAGHTCRSTNLGDNAGIAYTVQHGGNDVTIAELSGMLCTSDDYCPDTDITICCSEKCTPEGAPFNSICSDPVRFEVGFEAQSECVGPTTEIVRGACDVCQYSGSKVKPSSLTFRLIGGGTDSTNNQNGDATVSGNTLTAGPFTSASCGWTYNDYLTVSRFSGAFTHCTIAGPGGSQQIAIHTSCSKPMAIGDRFGAMELVSFKNYRGSSETVCPSTTTFTPAPACPFCCVMAPDPEWPVDRSVPKIDECTGPSEDVLPPAMKRQVQTWLDSFTCALTNEPMGQPTMAYHLVTTSGETEITDATDLEAALCETNEQGQCHFMQVRFSCCDPCRAVDSEDGPALCKNNTATFDLYDSTGPLIQFVDDSIECTAPLVETGAQIAWRETPRCVEGNTTAPGLIDGTPGGDSRCNRIVPVTATCADNCFNVKQKTRDFTITDTQAPIILPAASGRTVSCEANSAVEFAGWLADTGGARATDCRNDFSWSNNAIPVTSDCRAYPVTFTVNDPCNNHAATEAVFTVTDDIAPVISNANGDVCNDTSACVEETVECSSGTQIETTIAGYSGLTCADSCDGSPVWLGHRILSESHGENNCHHRMLIEYSCADLCGNVATTTAIFESIDVNPPVLLTDGPESYTIECDGDGNIEDLSGWLDHWRGGGNVQWAEDACQENPSCYNPSSSIEAEYYGELSSVGNYFQAKQMGPNSACSTTHQDPVCANGIDYTNKCLAMQNGQLYFSDGICNRAASPPPPSTSIDNCSYCVAFGASPVCIGGTTEYENYCYAYCVAGEFYVTNGPCDNTAAATTDTPVTDGYQTGDGTHTYITVSPGCDCPTTVDEICGSDGNTYMSRCVAECHGIQYYTLGSCLAMNCGETQLVYTASVSGPPTGDSCARTTPYEFQVIDQCNTGTLTATASFTTVDTTPPVITGVVPETVIECDGTGNLGAFYEWLSTNAGAMCTDVCGECHWNAPKYDNVSGVPTYTHCGQPSSDFYSSQDSSCDRCILVTFEAEDDCGFIAQTTSVFRTRDTRAPLLNGMNTKMECSASVQASYTSWLESDGHATAIDVPDCSGVALDAVVGEIFIFPSEGYEIPAGIHGTPPGTLPENIIHELRQTYEDDSFLETAKCPFVTVMRMTAVDNCGNQQHKNISYVIDDTTPPVFTTEPQDADVTCEDWEHPTGDTVQLQTWLNTGGGGVCDDSCDILPMPTTVPQYDAATLSAFSGQCPYEMVVPFYCEDFCGNTVTMNATFRIVDTTPPVQTAPVDKTVECGPLEGKQNQLDNWLDDRARSTAYDRCSSTGELVWNVTGSAFSQNEADTTRPNKCSNMHADGLFSVADRCGNQNNMSATFFVRDTIAPIITNGYDIEYTCQPSCSNAEDNARAIAEKWATGNGCLSAEDCQEYMEWSSVGLPSGNLCGTSGTVTFTATDGCGNARPQILRYNFPQPAPAPPPPTPGPPPPFTCEICGQSRKIQLKMLTFRWVSASGMNTVVSASGAWASNGGAVASGDTVVLSAGYNNKFSAWTTFETGSGSQSLHTSCSVALFVGDRIRFGSDYLEIVDFDSNGDGSMATLCPAPPPPPSPTNPPSPQLCPIGIDTLDVCTCIPQFAPAPPPPPIIREEVCGTGYDSKSTLLEFTYVGGNTLSNNQQGKTTVVGDSIDTAMARIVCRNDQSGYMPPAEIIAKGETYVFNGNGQRLGTQTTCRVQGSVGGNLIGSQVISIHTSCSKPLFTGDIQGALQITCFMTTTGETCSRQVTATGPGTQTARCPTSPPPPPTPGPPTLIPPAPAGQCNACGGSKQSLSSITFRYIGGNQLTNQQGGKASVSGGAMSGATGVTIACDASMMAVWDSTRKGSKSGGSGSTGMVTVDMDGSFSISNFNAETTCTIADGIRIQEVDIHTSCSYPLVIGDIYGSIVLTGFNGANTGIVNEATGCTGVFSSVYQRVGEAAAEDTCDGVDTCGDFDSNPTKGLTHIDLEYTGEWVEDHSQDDSGYGVLTDLNDQTLSPDAQEVRVTTGDYGVDTSSMAIGDRFRLSAAAIDRETLPQAVNIFIGSARIRFAFNCRAAPLFVGEQFGAIKVVGYGNFEGDSCALPEGDNAGANVGTATAGAGATSGSAIAGLVAGCVLVIVMMVGVFNLSFAKTGGRGIANAMSGTETETDTDSSVPPGDLDWDADVVTHSKPGVSSPGNIEARLSRPRGTDTVEGGN